MHSFHKSSTNKHIVNLLRLQQCASQFDDLTSFVNRTGGRPSAHAPHCLTNKLLITCLAI
jgi:hypothetical protein